jgi:exonuclease VII large subunit
MQRPMGQGDIQHIRDFARITQDSQNRLERLNTKVRDLVTQAKSASGEQQTKLLVDALDNIVQEHEFMMRDMVEARALQIQHGLAASGQTAELDNLKRDFAFLRDARGTVLGTDIPGMQDNKLRDHDRDMDKDKDKDKDKDREPK